MNTDSCATRRVKGYEEAENPGDYYFDAEGDPRYLHIILPGPTFIAIRVSASGATQNPNDGRGPVWHWDGNLDLPTVSPSIHCLEHWHGFLTAGQLKSC